MRWTAEEFWGAYTMVAGWAIVAWTVYILASEFGAWVWVVAVGGFALVAYWARKPSEHDDVLVERGRQCVTELIEHARRNGEDYMIPVYEIILSRNDPNELREAGRNWQPVITKTAKHQQGQTRN